jgi:hypothetical protein
VGSNNASGADNQQERPARTRWPESSEAIRQTPRTGAMRWSDLHGDVESWAEPKRPSHAARARWPALACNNVPKVAKFLVG